MRRTRRTVCVEALESRRLLAAIPELVANINTRGIGPDSIDQVASTPSAIYLSVNEPGQGHELWISDGTIVGTRLLKDIVPGRDSTFPIPLGSVGENLFFSAETPARGRELWVTDGSTEGTVPLPEVAAGEKGVSFTEAAVYGDSLYYLAEIDGARQLWRSDTTAGGTRLVAELSDARFLTTAAGFVFFRNETSETGGELWTSDGTPEGTRMVVELFPGPFGSFGPGELVDFQDRLLMGVTNVGSGSIHQLWQSDGTATGTKLVKDFGDLRFGPTDLTVFRDAAYFTVGYDDDRVELWKTDATESGTEALFEVARQDVTSAPLQLNATDDQLFFLAGGFGTGGDLWVTDGTTEGTRQLTNGAAGGPTQISEFRVSGGRLYFRAFTDASREEVWVSDGTVMGTRIAGELSPGNAAPRHLTPFTDRLAFVADGPGGRELYITDGTTVGTVQATDINTKDMSSDPTLLIVVEDNVFFRALDFNSGHELFVTDSATHDTKRLTDISPGPASTELSWLTPVGNTLFFVAHDPVATGGELWRSDGTAAGTGIVRDINVGRASSNPRDLVAMGERLFLATDFGLFISDGTDAGTSVLTEAVPQTGIVAVEDRVFFAADAPEIGRELWVSDGTVAGTRVVKDIRTGASGSSPEGFVKVGGSLLFRADDGQSGAELWRSDGTADGTVLVKDIFAASGSSAPAWMRSTGSVAYFIAGDAEHGRELWRSDGTPGGTTLVSDLEKGPSSGVYANLHVVGNRLFFQYNNELWVSSGTGDTTQFVSAVTPREFTSIGNDLHFTATHPLLGDQIWTSDGTPEGTRVVDPANSGSIYQNAGLPVSVNDTLYFAADNENVGRELWAVRTRDGGPQPLALQPDALSGHLFRGEFSGRLTPALIVQEQFVELRAGQMISIAVTPTGPWKPRISIFDPSGTVLGRAEVNSVNVALLNGLQLPKSGSYRLRVDSVDGSLGQFRATLLLNALYEAESFGAAGVNDTLASADSLDPFFVAVGPGIRQATLRGNLANADFFSTQLSIGSIASFVVQTSTGAAEVNLYDEAGTLLARQGVPRNSTAALQQFVAPRAGQYTIGVTGAGDYTLLVLQGAAFDDEPNEALDEAVLIDVVHTALGTAGDGMPGEITARIPPIRLTDGEGYRWPIGTQGVEGSDSFEWAINNSLISSGPSWGLEDKGREVVVAPFESRRGAIASRKVYVPEDGGFVRFVDTAHNPTSQTIVVPFQMNTRFRARTSPLELVGESRVDGTPTVDDRWMVFDDVDGTGMPAATIVWGQPDLGGLNTFEPDFVNRGGREEFTARYDIELLPGESKSIMVFVAQSATRAAAIDKAAALMTLAPEAALRGLTEAEKELIVNFDVPVGDLYHFAASAGDRVTVTVEATESGAISTLNTFRPRIELLDARGVVIASSEEQAATLTHLVETPGTYFTRLQSRAGPGGYLLRLDGATGEVPFLVTAVDPADETLLGVTPTDVRVDFGQSIFLPSVSPEDLTVDSAAATGVEIMDGDTLRFSLGNVAPGGHTIRIAAGSITDIRGKAIEEFTSSLVFNPNPAQVIGGNISSGDVLDAGAVTLSFEFSEAIRGAQFSSQDIQLIGHARGSIQAEKIGYDPSARTLTLTFADLEEDAYQLTLYAANDAFKTLAGVSLDGDNDGNPGGDYVFSFSTDIGTQSIDSPTSLGVNGLGVARSASDQRVLGKAADVDSFEVDVPASTFLSFVVRAGFHPTIRLFDRGSGELLNEITGDNQTVARLEYLTRESSNLQVDISGNGAGSYWLDSLWAATVEPESVGLGDNDSIASATKIGTARAPLVNDMELFQTAVVGDAVAGDLDYFAVDHDPTTTYSIVGTGIDGGVVESLRLLNEVGDVLFLGSHSRLVDTELTARWALATGQSTFFVEVKGRGDYVLAVRENIGFEVEPNNSIDSAQALGATGRMLGEVRRPGVLFLAQEREQQGLYVVDGSTGRTVRVGESDTSEVIVGLAPGPSPSELLVHNFNHFFQIATDGSGRVGDRIQREPLITGMAYDTVNRVLYGGTATRQLFELDPETGSVVRNLANPLGEIIGLAFGHGRLFAVHQSNTLLTSYDPASNSWQEIGDTGMVWSALAYDESSKQLFAIRGDAILYSIDPSTAEVSTVGPLLVEGEGFNIAATGGLAIIPGVLDPTGNGFASGPSHDIYQFSIVETVQNVSVSLTSVPSVGATELLVPAVQLIRPSGEILATRAATAGSETITLNIPQPVGGTYFVSVDATDDSSGRYHLSVEGNEPVFAAPPPFILGTTPDLSQPLDHVPSSLSIEFSTPILGTSVRASDLQISGIPAESLEVTGATTLRFDLPHLLAGTYDIELAGSLVDAFGQSVPAYSTRLNVPVEQIGPPGAWMSRAATSGTVASGLSQTIALSAREPQSAAISITPQAALAPRVRVIAPSGDIIAEVENEAGAAASVSTTFSASGIYLLEVSGVGASAGDFDLQTIFGGVVEVEPNGIGGAPQSLDDAFVAVSGRTSRVSVAGVGDGDDFVLRQLLSYESEPVFQHQFTFEGVPPSATTSALVHLRSRGPSSLETFVLDFEGGLQRHFKFDRPFGSPPNAGPYSMTLQQDELAKLLADGELSVSLLGKPGAVPVVGTQGDFVDLSIKFSSLGSETDRFAFTLQPGDSLAAAVADIEGGTAAVQIFDASGRAVALGSDGPDFNQVVEFTSSTGGDYIASVQAVGQYAFVAVKNGTLDTERNHFADQAQPLGPAGVAVGGISETGTLYYLTSAIGTIGPKVLVLDTFNLSSYFVEDRTTFQDVRDFDLRPRIDLSTGIEYRFQGHILAQYEVASSLHLRDLPPSPISIQEVALAPDGVYVIGFFEGNAGQLGFFDFNTNEWTNIGDTGRHLGGGFIEYDPLNDVLYGVLPLETDLLQIDTKTAEIRAIGHVPSTRGITLLFVPGETDPTGNGGTVLELGDRYQLSVQPGDSVVIETGTPSIPGNLLDPRIELFDASGKSLRVDSNARGDGRNARIEYTAAEAGPLQVLVTSENGHPGAYSLTVTGSVSGAEFTVAEVVPDTGATLDATPDSMTFRLSDPIDVTTIEPGDLRINGVPALAVEVLDGRRLRFSLPPLLTGYHQWSLDAEVMHSVFGRPLTALTSSFYVPPSHLGPELGQAFEIVGNIALARDAVTEVPVPLDDDQTFGAILQPSAGLAVRAELIDPRGRMLGTVSSRLGEEVLLPVTEILQSGTHLIRLTTLDDTAGAVRVQGLLNAAIELESISASTNDSPQSAEVARSRNLSDGQAKLGLLQGSLPFTTHSARRSGGVHGGSPVTVELRLEQEPRGDAELHLGTSNIDMRSEDRFIFVEIEGREPQQFFLADGQEMESSAAVLVTQAELNAIWADDGILSIRITPSLQVGDAADGSIGARLDYPTERFHEVIRAGGAAVAERITTATFRVPRTAFLGGTLRVTALGDFAGPEKTLELRLNSGRPVTLFGNSEPSQNGVYTTELPLSLNEIQQLTANNRNITVRLQPSAAIGQVADNFIELELDYTTAGIRVADSFHEGMNQRSPTNFRIPVETQATGTGVLTVLSEGFHYFPGASLQLDIEGRISQQVFGFADRFDVALHSVRVPISRDDLEALLSDGVVDVALRATGELGLRPNRYIEVQLEYATDEDFFRYDLAAGQSLSVGLDLAQLEHDIEVSILDSTGEIVAQGEAGQIFEQLVEFTPDVPGEYYVRLAGRGDYTLVTGWNVTLEREGSTAQRLATEVVVGGLRGRGGLIYAADQNALIHVIDSDSAEVETLDRSPGDFVRTLLGPTYENAFLFDGIDDENRWLYVSRGDVAIIDIATRDPVDFFDDISPPAIQEIAFGKGRLFGISAVDSLLYAFNPKTGRWSVAGDTGIAWQDGGLAYDDANDVLYAVNRGRAELLRIDPRSGITTPMGITGLINGGLLAYHQNLFEISPDWMRSGDQVDTYVVEASAGNLLSISIVGLGLGPLSPNRNQIQLDLVSPSGEVVATSTGTSPRLDHHVQQAGDFTIRVSPLDFLIGSYQLEVTGQSRNPRTPLATAFPGTGVFTATIEESLDEEPQEYVFALAADQEVSIVRRSVAGPQLPMAVLDPSGEVVRALDGAPAGLNENGLIRFVSNVRGDYTLRVQGPGSLLADVIVGATVERESISPRENSSVAESELLDFILLTGGGSRTTVYGQGNGSSPDYFHIAAAGGSTFDFAVAADGAAQVQLTLVDASGREIARGQATGGTVFQQAIARFTATSEDVYVRVEADSTYGFVATRDVILHTGNETTVLSGLGQAIGNIFPTGVLYFAADRGIGGGLWVVDTDNGRVWRAGSTGGTDNPGLAPFSSEAIFGSFGRQIGKYRLDRTGVDVLAESQDATGLAFDEENRRLYGVRNGSDQFYLLDVDTGRVVRELAMPPFTASGLTFGNGGVYALGFGALYYYDPSADTWTEIGETGMGWSDYGLAFNPFTNELYAKRSTDTTLYSINSTTAEVTPIGDTGIRWGGGLAFVKDIVDPTGNGATFSGSNSFSVRLASAAHYNFVTATFVGSTERALDARIEIYDAAGRLLAVDEDGAADGVNANLRFQAPAAGVYEVRVSAENGTFGSYQLSFATNSVEDVEQPRPILGSLLFNAGATFNNRIDTISIEFTEDVTVLPKALEIHDVGGTRIDTSDVLQITRENLLTFDLTSTDLSPGAYVATVRRDAVQDAAGNNIASDIRIGEFSIALPGDADLDGKVAFGDFLVLASNFGEADTAWGQGDFDRDRIVRFSDFLLLSSNFEKATDVPFRSLPGDANLDGRADFSDFSVVAANFGRTDATRLDGDFNLDGEVNFTDFLLLSSSFGSSLATNVSVAFAEDHDHDWWLPDAAA